MVDKIDVHREFFENKNIRFLGYNFLKNVMFNGEPVVPVIISEDNDVNGMHFNVEKLGGESLDYFMCHSKISLKEKLKVMHHVVMQLEAIDKAGIVLFDRIGPNVRVLSWGDRGISTRQVDTEDFYDKSNDALYSDHRDKYMANYVDIHKRLKQDPWSMEVSKLAYQITKNIKVRDLNNVDFEKYDSLDEMFNIRPNDLAKKPLENFRKDIEAVLVGLN